MDRAQDRRDWSRPIRSRARPRIFRSASVVRRSWPRCRSKRPRGAQVSMTPLRIGVDIGGTKIEALALDAAGREVFRKRMPTPRGDYDATISAVKGLVEQIDSSSGVKGSVGIGIPGALSRATGRVKNANSTWLIGRSLKEDLERALKREIRLENDANCFALSEAVDGAGQGARVVFGA